ncbi:class I SAM-dependent methyltransferase [Azotosporobacter soli]|uniref:class I SAM-dependent methyltransferase n=1 Tax=Azotosporobacter soli TaxID=3055040 RepID=UPI0031FEA1CC
MQKHVIVTTSGKTHAERETYAKEAANILHCAYVVRSNLSLPQLQEQHQAENILVVKQSGCVLHTAGGEFFFHPSMAELRLLQLKRGQSDHMLAAMALEPGMRVLDCTLGLGTDAIVASWGAGATGYVCGLEVAPLTAFIVKAGLQQFLAARENVAPIEVLNVDYEQFLCELPDKSFDVVFFDPMFRQPISSSSQLKPMRSLADHRPLAETALNEAIRVAKHRVVVKEISGSQEFCRLGITKIYGGRYSSVQYGVIDLQAGDKDE